VLLVAAGLFYTNQANRKQQQLGLDQQKLALQGQAADRFTAAIDQIGQEGNDKLSIRLGGVYSLQRLMRDSPTDEPTVIQVLCAFIRTHATPDIGNVSPTDDPLIEVRPSPADVRAALAVLGQRPYPDQPDNATLDLAGTMLGLDGIKLSRADLSGADLIFAVLENADLSGADLSDADLESANLAGAHLAGADLSGADLSDAELSDADLSDARLSDAYLLDAHLGGANLSGADLSGANLRGADLTGAHLSGADLSRAHLRGANLSGTELRGADLRGADLSGAKLGGRELGGANLSGANLSRAHLNGADLSGVDLRGAYLGGVTDVTQRQLAAARIDEKTVLPDGLVRPKPSSTR